MYFKDILMLSVKTRHGQTRAVLTALMVCIGISSVILISAIGDSGKSIINEELEKLGICG